LRTITAWPRLQQTISNAWLTTSASDTQVQSVTRSRRGTPMTAFGIPGANIGGDPKTDGLGSFQLGKDPSAV